MAKKYESNILQEKKYIECEHLSNITIKLIFPQGNHNQISDIIFQRNFWRKSYHMYLLGYTSTPLVTLQTYLFSFLKTNVKLRKVFSWSQT